MAFNIRLSKTQLIKIDRIAIALNSTRNAVINWLISEALLKIDKDKKILTNFKIRKLSSANQDLSKRFTTTINEHTKSVLTAYSKQLNCKLAQLNYSIINYSLDCIPWKNIANNKKIRKDKSKKILVYTCNKYYETLEYISKLRGITVTEVVKMAIFEYICRHYPDHLDTNGNEYIIDKQIKKEQSTS